MKTKTIIENMLTKWRSLLIYNYAVLKQNKNTIERKELWEIDTLVRREKE